MRTAYTVSELNHYIKHLLESDGALSGVGVEGEVSNLTYHSSGHVYFTLKDRQSQLSCVMFRGDAIRAERMQTGDKVKVTGSISVYPPHGKYQMVVKGVSKAGQGDLYQKYLKLKEKLKAEGLFDPARKKVLPTFPGKIVVITSATGAAVRDIIRTLRRRYDRAHVILIPTTVQGAQGAASIISSLAKASALDPDVIILGRGGGSIEDLWNFNEESVAYAIADCAIPIVAGIGHETDVTIADYVADLRASTPSAAAELSVPDLEQFRAEINGMEDQLARALQYYLDFSRQLMDDYSYRLSQGMEQLLQDKRRLLDDSAFRLRSGMENLLQQKQQLLDDLLYRLHNGVVNLYQRRRHDLDLLEAKLRAQDVSATLKRGFTLTLREGQILRSGKGLATDTEIETVFHDQKIKSRIE